MAFMLSGGRVLGADGSLRFASVVMEGALITEVRDTAPSSPSAAWDARGLLVLPGIVDLHGDAFERQIMPRPGVRLPLDAALLETDRQLVVNGITTAYHGITYSWEPGLRGRGTVHDLLTALRRLEAVLACDTRVHLRFETYNVQGVDDIKHWLAAGQVHLIGFNDHWPQLRDRMGTPRAQEYADRAGLSLEALGTLVTQTGAQAPQVEIAITDVAEAARTLGIAMLSHDDESPEMRRRYHDLGAHVCEFPVDEATAAASRALGDAIILGAPNVLRGGSHCARLDATQAVARGLCTVLTSDYYYPALLRAPFTLVERSTVGFALAWALVSANPAAAAGLTDRGSIAAGKRADLIVVDDRDRIHPRVVMAVVAGQPVYQAGDLSGTWTTAAA